MDVNERLNPEPTDSQLSLFQYHKQRGTSPGNPKWYKPLVVKPFNFVPNLPPKYPHLPTGAQWFTKHSSTSATECNPVVIRYVDGSTREMYI